MNYDYLDHFRKAYELSTDSETKQGYLLTLKEQEAFRDFYTGEGYQIHLDYVLLNKNLCIS